LVVRGLLAQGGEVTNGASNVKESGGIMHEPSQQAPQTRQERMESELNVEWSRASDADKRAAWNAHDAFHLIPAVYGVGGPSRLFHHLPILERCQWLKAIRAARGV
jgi:hypothetical protein